MTRTPNDSTRASSRRLRRKGYHRAAGLFALLLLPVALAGQVAPPDATWYTFETRHFQVIYSAGLEEVAGRAAERGERAIERLEGFGSVPDLTIQMVVTDHMDLSNGSATVIPYPHVVLWARPSMDGPGPIPFDDWLELLVTHEVVHVLHLEMTGPLGRAGRAVFGRAPIPWPLFPAFTLPPWAIEGVAVHAETELTDGGRIHGSRLESTVRAQALGGRLERIDQVVGNSAVFPAGDRPYVYGGLFYDHLVHRFGTRAVTEFFHRQAGRLNPYRLDATAREVFGHSLTDLHAEWREAVRGEARLRSDEVRERARTPDPRLLTRGARMALHPRFDPATGDLLYSRADGRSEPSLVRIPGDCGLSTCPEERIHRLHVAGAASPISGSRFLLVQPDFVDRYRMRNDLWRIDARGNREVLTRGLRASAIDARIADERIVAVLEGGGTHRLVLLDGDGTELRELASADPGVLWGQPRWSPDGGRIAVVRWRAGGIWEVVVLDGDGTELAVLDRGRAPMAGVSWAPDGDRVVWTSERTGVANVFSAPVAPGAGGAALRQHSDLVTAGAFPEVSPDGTRLVLSVLGADGWDLAELPFGPEAGFTPDPPAGRFQDTGAGAMAAGHLAAIRHEARPWSPRATLRPRHWTPWALGSEALAGTRVLPPVIGGATGATDAVGRNRWTAAVGVPVGSGIGRREGHLFWEWAGLGNPVISGGVDQRWITVGRALVREDGPDASERELLVVARERSAGLRLGGLRPGLRTTRSAALEVRGIRQDRSFLDVDGVTVREGPLPRTRRDLAEGAVHLGLSRARGYALSVSPQDGLAAYVRLRARRELALPEGAAGVRGRDGAYRDLVVVLQGYRPLPGDVLAGRADAERREGPAVAAVRVSAGVAGGPGAGAGHYRIGGADPVLFPVRGVASGVRSGSGAWTASTEIRMPLVRFHRGRGLFPLHLDQLAGAVFLDAGAAFRRSPDPDVIATLGAELSLRHTVFFHGTDRLRAGLAIPLTEEARPVGYAAFGWAF